MSESEQPKKATVEEPDGPATLKAIFQKSTTRKWNERYLADPRFRQTKLFYPEVEHSKSKKLMKLPRYLLSRCIRYISGHCFLRLHMQKLQEWDGDTYCRLCEDRVEVESPWHIIAECDSLCIRRQAIFGQPNLEPDGSWDPDCLAAFLKKAPLATLEDDGMEINQDCIADLSDNDPGDEDEDQ